MRSPTADPYAPPQADLELSADRERLIRHWGKLVLVPRDVPLPERCVKCNRAGDGGRLTPRLFYYHWALMLAVVLLLIVIWPVALVVALLGRKSATVAFSLCRQHQRRRQIYALAALFFLASAIFVPWIGFNTAAIDHDVTIGLGVVALLVGLLIAALRGQPLRIARIEDDVLYLRGASPEFRGSFREAEDDGVRP
jgi:uncharacterized paraquat-inducible protein A